MAQKVLNEEQMREYVEQEVRSALMNENMDEGWIMDKIMGLLNGGSGKNIIGSYIKEHMNPADLINLAIGIFGVAPIARWLCNAIGIDVNGPLAKVLITALSGMGAMAIGDKIQAGRAAAGQGGATSLGGGSGFSGGGEGGGSR